MIAVLKIAGWMLATLACLIAYLILVFKVIDKYTDEVFIVYAVNNRSFLIYHPKHEYWGWELMDGFKPYEDR